MEWISVKEQLPNDFQELLMTYNEDAKMSGKYFYKDKFFEKEEDFWAFVKAWPDLPFDIEIFEKEVKSLIEEARMNKEMIPYLTNKQGWQLLRPSTDWVEYGK